MSEFTYESQTNESALETFEWDNVWWEHTEDLNSKRVVYIGDSISCVVRHIATNLSGNTLLFDGFGTSKALDNPYFKPSLIQFLSQEAKIDALLFNNGLHGWHLSESEYEKEYRSMIEFLKENVKAPIFILLTTGLENDPERNEIVKIRNEAAQKVAKELELPIIDLFSVSQEHSDLHLEDGVHFKNEGYTVLAEEILKSIKPL